MAQVISYTTNRENRATPSCRLKKEYEFLNVSVVSQVSVFIHGAFYS
jgi:hypothetical protein